MKSVLINDKIHKELKRKSNGSGIKIKVIVETAIANYLKQIKLPGEEQNE